MTKQEASVYFRVLDAAFKHFTEAYPGGEPRLIVLSYDMEEFIENEGIDLGAPVIGADMDRHSIVMHAPVET